MPTNTAEITALSLFRHIFCKYGVCSTLITDQGTHFNNRLMSALQHLIGYNHILSIPYHSQSNGVVERFNASMVVQVSKLGMRLGMYQYQNSSKTFGFWVLWFWVQLWVLGLGLVLGLGSLG